MKTEIRLWIIRETEKAYRFSKVPQSKWQENEDLDVWVPRSLIECITKLPDKNDGFRECLVTIQEWVAEKKGLI